MTDDERAIRAVVTDGLAASQAGDLQAVLNLMTEDVIFLVPGQPPFGKQAFAAMSEGMKAARIEGTGDIQEVQVFGDVAYLRNHLRITVTPLGGGPVMRRSGPTLSILRKETDGRWRLARDANLVIPDPEPA
ncbi:SgcJ/EcaC family oxidoreductase [Ralstonia syzygii]|uniref:Putative ketosteroid isomerase homolog protein n=1 Tax=Ralstonia syzygii R24 TaxID=907261 RepID=G3A226_9RALS|nr:SgcJ/EcaC family oxidoreductase [Ralstonia syzygii]CCA85458.1 putative ketosteroid isomerase homolog protein [Ralstonia syzygii R24]